MHREHALKLLTLFKQQHADEFGIVRLGIFGSVARNEATERSDVDIVVQTLKPDLFNLVHIKETLQELLHANVDIVRYREKMNPYLKRNIEKEAIYV